MRDEESEEMSAAGDPPAEAAAADDGFADSDVVESDGMVAQRYADESDEAGAVEKGDDDVGDTDTSVDMDGVPEEVMAPDEEDGLAEGDRHRSGEEIHHGGESPNSHADGEPDGDADDAEPERVSEDAPGGGEGQATEEEGADTDEAEDDGDEEEEPLPLLAVVEAVLFAAREPLKPAQIARAVGRRTRQEAVRQAIGELNVHYLETGRAFEVADISGRYQLMSRPEFARHIMKIYPKKDLAEKDKSHRLTPTALDTLAIIAYKQPVTRGDIEHIRGVACGSVLKTLIERGSVRVVGKRTDLVGQPRVYGTTEAFLAEFGLGSLDELPLRNDFLGLLGDDPGVVELLPDTDADGESGDGGLTAGDGGETEDGIAAPAGEDDPATEAGEGSGAGDAVPPDGHTVAGDDEPEANGTDEEDEEVLPPDGDAAPGDEESGMDETDGDDVADGGVMPDNSGNDDHQEEENV